MAIQTSLSPWEGQPREGFSAWCMNRFAVNFDNAPTFIVRSEFIRTKSSESHQLRKYPLDPKTGIEARRQS